MMRHDISPHNHLTSNKKTPLLACFPIIFANFAEIISIDTTDSLDSTQSVQTILTILSLLTKSITYNTMKQILAVGLASLLLSSTNCLAQSKSNTWNPNLPGNKYKNPIIDADYSDPDVCRVGNDYYMTSSSFACFPGLQILHSTDLVNWEIIGAALTDDYPVLPENKGKELDWRKKIQHGNYVWAPAIRYHDGWFYIYCGDPDQGLFMTKTQDPRAHGQSLYG